MCFFWVEKHYPHWLTIRHQWLRYTELSYNAMWLRIFRTGHLFKTLQFQLSWFRCIMTQKVLSVYRQHMSKLPATLFVICRVVSQNCQSRLPHSCQSHCLPARRRISASPFGWYTYWHRQSGTTIARCIRGSSTSSRPCHLSQIQCND